jgi:preprotein translocase subunit Sec61beta
MPLTVSTKPELQKLLADNRRNVHSPASAGLTRFWKNKNAEPTHNPVGASLLAIAFGQSTSMMNVRPQSMPLTVSTKPELQKLLADNRRNVHSPASAGLTRFWKNKNAEPTHNPAGASLLAIAFGQSTSMMNVRPQSRASSLPH